MTAKKNLTDALAVFSLAGLLYCFAAYLFIQPLLTPKMPEPAMVVRTLGNIVIPTLFLVGIYHLILLIRAFKALAVMQKGRFLHSLFMVAVALSGLFLLSDLTLLSDIGKEYLLWEVGDQWLMLYGFTFFHLIVVAYGFLSSRKSKSGKTGRSRVFNSGSDAFYVTMHQIGIVCGTLGILGIFISLKGIVPDRFRTSWMLFISGLALFPWAIFIFYMIMKNRRKPISNWFDEKQMTDTATGALISMIVVMPLLALFSLLDSIVRFGLPVSFWLMLIFFMHLIVFSCVTLVRSREEG
jgi:hypothetical protein